MGPQMLNQYPIPLRVITQRLTSTPTWQLPQVVPFLANTISESGKHFLTTEIQHQTRDEGDYTVLVHKYKTQISTLLQDRSAQGRWAAVVLIKATVGVGGWGILQGIEGWVRGLLGILGVSDPVTWFSPSILQVPPTAAFVEHHLRFHLYGSLIN